MGQARIVMLLASSLIVGACGGGGTKGADEPAKTTSSTEPLSNTQPEASPSPPPPPASPSQKAMAAMEVFEKKMCACLDNSCAKRVADEMNSWSQQMAKEQTEPVKLSEEEMKRATEIGTRMGECMQKAMGASNP